MVEPGMHTCRVVQQVVWDMDGTLLDSSGVVPDAFVAAVGELGGGAVDRNEVVAAYSLGVPEVMLEHLLHRKLASGEEDAYYHRLLDASISPYAGVADTLAELRDRGHLIVVFTGASERAASTLLRAAGIDVNLLLGGDRLQHPKPAPDGLLLAARELHVDPAHLAYVGDAPTDLQAAKAAGAMSVAAMWGHLYDANEPADVALQVPRDVMNLLIQT